jgi:multicomponent Na+:H+ antiporter subunit E
VPRAILRAVILAGGFWALAEGDRSAIAFGFPVVALALLTSIALPSHRSPRWSPLWVSIFVLTFLGRSLRAGFDVAYRALAPSLPISPAMVTYRLRIPPGSARDLFMATLSLMPGTLGASLHGHDLEVHVLAYKGEKILRDIERWEARVARALGEPLGDTRA